MKPTVVFQGHALDPETFHTRMLRCAQVLQSAGIGDGDVVALMRRQQAARGHRQDLQAQAA